MNIENKIKELLLDIEYKIFKINQKIISNKENFNELNLLYDKLDNNVNNLKNGKIVKKLISKNEVSSFCKMNFKNKLKFYKPLNYNIKNKKNNVNNNKKILKFNLDNKYLYNNYYKNLIKPLNNNNISKNIQIKEIYIPEIFGFDFKYGNSEFFNKLKNKTKIILNNHNNLIESNYDKKTIDISITESEDRSINEKSIFDNNSLILFKNELI